MTGALTRIVDWLLVDAAPYVLAWCVLSFLITLVWVLMSEWGRAHDHRGPMR